MKMSIFFSACVTLLNWDKVIAMMEGHKRQNVAASSRPVSSEMPSNSRIFIARLPFREGDVLFGDIEPGAINLQAPKIEDEYAHASITLKNDEQYHARLIRNYKDSERHSAESEMYSCFITRDGKNNLATVLPQQEHAKNLGIMAGTVVYTGPKNSFKLEAELVLTTTKQTDFLVYGRIF